MSVQEFSQRMRKLREERGWTQREVAERLGIPTNSYSGYERGAREPDFAMVVRIARLYQVSVDYLLGLSDERSISNERLAVMNRSLVHLPEEDKETLLALIDAYLESRRRRRGHELGSENSSKT